MLLLDVDDENVASEAAAETGEGESAENEHKDVARCGEENGRES